MTAIITDRRLMMDEPLEKEDFAMNEMATWKDDASRTFYFLKGYASAKELDNMQKALLIARNMHEGQYRKGGAEYLVHPLRVCAYLAALGFNDDVLLSASLLHDVIEDVEAVRNDPQSLVNNYGISQEIVDLVCRLTKTKITPTEVYYKGVSEDWRALMIKLSDRCNNVSTLDCFTYEKMRAYIEETKNFVLPLCRYAKLHYPRYNNEVTIMKYHITALCSTVEKFLPMISGNATDNKN